MIYPFAGKFEITQGFMQDNAALIGGFHKGIDWALPKGTSVLAINSGTVIKTGTTNREGRFIILKIGKYQVHYFHLDRVFVSQGQDVFEGQKIGLSGDTGLVTGPHLHIQVYKDGVLINPLEMINTEPVAAIRGYEVRAGDTLSQISKDLNVGIHELLDANPNLNGNPDLIFAGSILNIPTKFAGTIVTVKPGDTLWGIATSRGMTVEQLRKKNPELPENPRKLQVGTEIRI